MNAHTIIRPIPPIKLLRALAPGKVPFEYRRHRKMAALFGGLRVADMEAGVELLLAELDARQGDVDLETGGGEDEPLTGYAAMGITGPGCPYSDQDEDDDQDTGVEDDPRGCDPEAGELTSAECVCQDRNSVLWEDDDDEPAHMPPMMDGPIAANDQVPA